jgi:hypothetical protein
MITFYKLINFLTCQLTFLSLGPGDQLERVVLSLQSQTLLCPVAVFSIERPVAFAAVPSAVLGMVLLHAKNMWRSHASEEHCLSWVFLDFE